MKNSLLLLLFNFATASFVFCQEVKPTDSQEKAIRFLIDEYSRARETNDTVLLKTILTKDVDQLVSDGEWREGIGAAMSGMLKSSGGNPGTRTLQVEKIRMLSSTVAIADCKYEIQSYNGAIQKMWSSFIAVYDKANWRISAIRNMLPASK